MDQRERAEDFQEALRAAMDGRLGDVWTALPGIVETYDAEKQVVSVQPAIQRAYRGPDGAETMLTLPLLLDCPVMFPGGGGVTLTFPIVKGDECLVVFASRCIDSWWQSGGIQPPAEFRMQDLSDGFAFVGVRSQPRKLTAVSTSKAQLRSDDGETYVDLDPAGHVVTIKATNIILDGPVHITGVTTADQDINVTGTVTASTDVVGGGKHLKTHTHSGVTTGSGSTGAPN